MKNFGRTEYETTPQILLQAYCHGIFPMANSADDPDLFWVEPDVRAILPLDKFHVPRTLKKTLRKDVFDIRYNQSFNRVVEKCAEKTGNRKKTWINRKIRFLYGSLHNMGCAHSIEAWQDDKLCGGLYGVSIGGAFFGESMFSRQSDASKVCLVHLVEHLKENGFSLLDTQFSTSHLERFGVIEISRNEYMKLLKLAVGKDVTF